VYDRGGRPAFSFFAEQRVDVPLDRVSPHVVNAVTAVEDRRFFAHHGIDPPRVFAAAWRNLRAGRIVEGGSTITQQLARLSQLSPVRTYERKMREVLLAARIEEQYTKPQILEQYLNAVYFGGGLYGVEAASRGYFGKSAADLQPEEAALLAALVRSPSADAPFIAPDRAHRRRDLVLRLMRQQGKLTEDQYRRALATPLPERAKSPTGRSSVLAGGDPGTGLYFQEEIRRQLVSLVGSDKLLRGGLRVQSTYDPGLQREAERTVVARITEIAKMHRAARDLQGSLVSMDPVSGDVFALVGGRDFGASRFNRATQARRQAGSAFKPIIYAAAIERGYAPGTLIGNLDAPIDAGGTEWLPSGEHERPEYTLRRALKVSSNRAAAQLLQQVGVNTAIYYAQRMGIESPLPMVPSLALGTGDVTLLELTAAYSAFANQGLVVAPRFITRIEDSQGAVIYDAPERHTQAISSTTAFLMSSMLSDVLSSGTGTAARAAGFKLPAAGKTGTTDQFADAWFIGYTPHLLTGIWFGLDRPAPIMREGFAGVVAVPAWGRFMRAATAGARPDWYPVPPGIEKVAICRLSGARATEACREQADANGSPVYEDYFPAGTVPDEPCPIHSAVVPLDAGIPTPMVDSILQANSPTGTSGTTPDPNYRIVIERVLGPDGVMHVIMKQVRR
jgi:penicillin-binding protein 1A